MRARDFLTEEHLLNEVMPVITRNNSLAQAKKNIGITKKTVGSTSTIKPTGTSGTKQQAANNLEPEKVRAADQAVDRLIRPGAEIPLPTNLGRAEKFKITQIKGDEVEIENPDARRDNAQPKKITFKRDDIKKSIAI
jgi:hypothetical protein